MRLAALVALVLALVTGACAGDGDETDAALPDGELSLLTYNVAGLPQEVSTENPQEHLPLISPLLEPYDLVLTQEDFDWWLPVLDPFDFVHYHERLRADVTHEHRSGRHPGPEAAGLDPTTRPTLAVGDGLGYLSRLPTSDDERVAWRGCFGGIDTSDGGAGDCLAMKGFAVTTVELAPGVEVDVYNLHNEAGGTDEDQRLQQAAMEQLAAHIAERSEGRAVIVAGDTNLHTESDHPDAAGGADTTVWATFLEATGLTDACVAVDCAAPDSIDKVAVRGSDTLSITVTAHDFPSTLFRGPAGEPLSDHEPLAVVLRWAVTT